jgi:hypothetical protein
MLDGTPGAAKVCVRDLLADNVPQCDALIHDSAAIAATFELQVGDVLTLHGHVGAGAWIVVAKEQEWLCECGRGGVHVASAVVHAGDLQQGYGPLTVSAARLSRLRTCEVDQYDQNAVTQCGRQMFENTRRKHGWAAEHERCEWLCAEEIRERRWARVFAVDGLGIGLVESAYLHSLDWWSGDPADPLQRAVSMWGSTRDMRQRVVMTKQKNTAGTARPLAEKKKWLQWWAHRCSDVTVCDCVSSEVVARGRPPTCDLAVARARWTSMRWLCGVQKDVVWRAMHNNLRIGRRTSPAKRHCLVCPGAEVESGAHLFVHCSVAVTAWSAAMTLWRRTEPGRRGQIPDSECVYTVIVGEISQTLRGMDAQLIEMAQRFFDCLRGAVMGQLFLDRQRRRSAADSELVIPGAARASTWLARLERAMRDAGVAENRRSKQETLPARWRADAEFWAALWADALRSERDSKSDED